MLQTKALSLVELLTPERIDLDVPARSKAELLRWISDTAAHRLGLPKGPIHAALADRETLGSTGIGDGVALPHAGGGTFPSLAGVTVGRSAGLNAPYVALTRLTAPIDFDSIDQEPVDLVVTILVPSGEVSLALRVTAMLCGLLRSTRFLAAVRRASSSGQVYGALVEEVLFA